MTIAWSSSATRKGATATTATIHLRPTAGAKVGLILACFSGLLVLISNAAVSVATAIASRFGPVLPVGRARERERYTATHDQVDRIVPRAVSLFSARSSSRQVHRRNTGVAKDMEAIMMLVTMTPTRSDLWVHYDASRFELIHHERTARELRRVLRMQRWADQLNRASKWMSRRA